MKKTMLSTLAAAVMLLPTAAFASVPLLCSYTREEPVVVAVPGEDDPDIPNCVMYPSTPYLNGVCERVHYIVQPAGSTYMAPCQPPA